MTARYEAVAAPGIFFAGTVGHARDFKKASGGFVHGLRYTARALHRALEEEEARAAARGGGGGLRDARGWPRIPVPHTRALAAALLQRINVAGGLFQMFGQLVDVFLRSPNCTATHGIATLAAAAGRPTSAVSAAGDADSLMNRTYLVGAESFPAPQLCGWYFEEVPVAAVPDFVERWAAELVGGVPGARSPLSGSPAVTYLTLSLEFGVNGTAPGNDPFRLGRADIPPVFPEKSNFLHPVVRLYDSRVHVPHVRPPPPPPSNAPRQWWRAPPDPQIAEALAEAAANPDAAAASDDLAHALHVAYLYTAREAADEAMDTAGWTRTTALAADADMAAPDAAAAVASCGPRPAGFLTPVATHHTIEDFLNKFDQPDRHVAPLLRFLEHTASGLSTLGARETAQAHDASLRLARVTAPPPALLSPLLANLQNDDSPVAWMPAVASYMPAYPVGFLTYDRLSSTPLPAALAGRIAAASAAALRADEAEGDGTGMRMLGGKADAGDADGSDGDDDDSSPPALLDGKAAADEDAAAGAAAVEVWTPEVIGAVTAEHAARQALFRHLQSDRQATRLTAPLFRIMTMSGGATLYKSNWEVRRAWAAAAASAEGGGGESAAATDAPVGVFKVPAGYAWMFQLPVTVRDAIMYDGPGSRIMVLLVHGGMAAAGSPGGAAPSRAAASAEGLLRSYAARLPELPFVEVYLPAPPPPGANPDAAPDWDTVPMVGGYDRTQVPDTGHMALEVLHYLRVDPADVYVAASRFVFTTTLRTRAHTPCPPPLYLCRPCAIILVDREATKEAAVDEVALRASLAAKVKSARGDFALGFKDELKRAARGGGSSRADAPTPADHEAAPIVPDMAARLPESHYLEIHQLPIGTRSGQYFNGALRARLLMAAKRANVTIAGLEGVLEGAPTTGSAAAGAGAQTARGALRPGVSADMLAGASVDAGSGEAAWDEEE